MVLYTGALLLSNHFRPDLLLYLTSKYEFVVFKGKYGMRTLVALIAANALCTVCLWRFVKAWGCKENKEEHADEFWDELEH